jgi:cytoskeleton protein RodZ
MALDVGGVTHLQVVAGSEHDVASGAPAMPSIDSGSDIGAVLRAAREFRGLSLEQVADTTRIRRAYIAAIEDMRLEELPSRPFTIGYVRAYALLLGLNPDEAVARFKTDGPEEDDALRAPVGVRHEGDPRLGVAILGGIAIVGVIVLWNIAQRAITAQAPKPQNAEIAEVVQNAGPAQVALGAPLPAPVESTTPAPYITPGLAEAAAAGGSADASTAATKAAAVAAAAAPAVAMLNLGAPFKPEGQVYGSTENASNVVLLARKAGLLVARGADGSVYFARQLAAGEAYRAPALGGLVIDVSDPAAFEVYVGGALTGHLPATQTPLSKVAG